MTSKWEQYQIEERLTTILSKVHYVEHVEHHFRRTYLSAYQLAIKFARRHPTATGELGYPVGGKGIGQRTSLSQYLTPRAITTHPHRQD